MNVESKLFPIFAHHNISNWRVEEDQVLKKVYIWTEVEPSEALVADFEKIVLVPWLIEFRELRELES